MNEQEQFLKDTEEKEGQDIFDVPLDTKVDQKAIDDNPELAEESVKDRRHKRLEAKLQAERESNIALNARLLTIAEARKSEEVPAEYLKSVERIYGTDSPEALAATELLKNALKGVKEEAKSEALETFKAEQLKLSEAEKKEAAELDSILEELEDDYGVDLTSPKSEEIRKAFFKNLEKMSPKDSDGNVLHYADHKAVWEDFSSRIQKKTENRAKNLSDRSMIHSAASNSKVSDDAALRFLKENGIV